MDEWANAWTRYYTGGKGNYMIAAMEDTGTLQALTFLNQAGRVDLKRVLVLRTVSNYDREAPGTTPAEAWQVWLTGKYSGLLPALEAAETVGDKVVRDIVEHWAEREIDDSTRTRDNLTIKEWTTCSNAYEFLGEIDGCLVRCGFASYLVSAASVFAQTRR